MVGICGSLGKEYDIENMIDFFKVIGNEKSEWYRDNTVDIGLVKHKGVEKRIKEIDNNIVLLFGEIYSYKKNGEYTRPPLLSTDVHRFILNEYKKQKDKIFSRLNGNFLIILYNSYNHELKIISDRLGTIPLFIFQSKNGLIFTTKIQSFAKIDIDLRFNQDFLQEYFTFGSVFGINTPIRNIEKMPPSTILNIDLNSKNKKIQPYWVPKYTPLDKSFDYFVDDLHKKLKEAIVDRVQDNLNYSLMLSGGFDSRLINAMLNEIDQEITCYHLNENYNDEAKLAKKVASISENEFIFLQRKHNHTMKKLRLNPKFNNFYGTFDNQRATVFKNDLKVNDVVFNGAFADTILKNMHLPNKRAKIEKYIIPLPTINLPITKDSYVAEFCRQTSNKGEPYYFIKDKKIHNILKENINFHSFKHHSISFSNINTLMMMTPYYPISNRYTYGVLDSISEIACNSHRDPFLDNRIIEFQLKMPLRLSIKKSLVSGVLSKYYPKYAEIPNPFGLKASDGFIKKDILRKINLFNNKYLRKESTSWTNRRKLVSEGYFDDIWDKDELEELPFIDSKKAERMYENVKNGKTHFLHLYRLLTYSNMPITKKIMENVSNKNIIK